MPTPEDMQQQRDIGKIWGAIERQGGEVRELKTALIGLDGRNGLRGELREFILEMRKRMDDQDRTLEAQASALEEVTQQGEQRLQSTEMRIDHVVQEMDRAIAWGRDIWEHKRFEPGNCIGKQALEDHLDSLAAKEADLAKAEAERSKRDAALEVEMKKSRNAVVGSVAVAIITIGIPAIVSLARDILLRGNP